MSRKTYLVTGLSALLALTMACGRHSAAPVSPTSVGPVALDEAAGASGQTLKVSAPTLVSPANGAELQNSIVALTCSPSSAANASAVPLEYDFEIYDANNVKVQTAVVSGTTWSVQGLEFAKRFTWRVRGTASYVGGDGKTVQAFGPWSNFWSFQMPENRGYIRGNELYDPLINGETVGQIHGPTHFIPGVGISMDSLDAYISYSLPQPLIEGEFSMLATNVRTRHEGGKTKLMAMAQNYDDITENDRRMTFEKRSDGTVAWRLITHNDQIETGSSERVFVQFNLVDTFLFQLSWRNNIFNPLIKRGGANGQVIYSQSKHWAGAPYDPDPHVAYVGGPGGRAGNDSGTVPNIVIRQVWISPSARPASINQ